MGRRKIQILPITDDRNRNVTFGKRRNGLFKKAYELGVLCSADVAVLVWGHNGKLYAFSSQGQLKNMVDRYHSQRADEIDLTGPAHYGDVNDPAMRAALNMSGLMGNTGAGAGTSAPGVKGGKGSHKKRRRSEDDSDEDEDDEGDEEDAHDLAQTANNLSSSAPTGYPPHDPHMYANGSSMSSHDNQYNPPPHMAHHHQQQQQQHPHASLSGPSHSMPPYFGGPAYPYPGYPHHMPNVNPALAAGGPASNPLNFYGPTAAAIAAAAAATGSYNYGGLPPHLLRAAAQQYAQELQQQQNGNNGNGTPQSGSSTGQYVGNNNGNNGYAPMRTSPVPMDPSAHHTPDPSTSSYAHQHHSQQHRQNSGHSPGQSNRNRPNLHLSLSGQQQQQPQHGSNGPPARQDSTGSNMHLGQSTQQYHSQQSQDDMQMRRDSYSLPNGNNDNGGSSNANNNGNNNTGNSNNDSLGLPAGLQFPDSYITSPSQLFPEIYRSMNAYAEAQAGGGRGLAAFGGEDTPTREDGNINNNDEDAGTASAEAVRNVFRWPTMSGSGSNATSSSTGGGTKNGAHNGNLTANVKREGDEGDGSGMDR